MADDETSGPSSSDAPNQKSAAGTVAAGIFVSRIFGFVREGVIAYFFGVGAHTDALQAAFRGPNLLQNLLGEGTISAAFIPIYSRLLDEGRPEDAGRFAGAIFGLLLALTAALVLLGIVFAEPLATVIVPGYVGDGTKVAAGELAVNRFDLVVRAFRFVFPMAGLLVLSAWALGVLNSHRRFFVPYIAPVLWNVAIIGSLFLAGFALVGSPLDAAGDFSLNALETLFFAAFWGALIGGALQFLVQLPLVLRMMKGFRVRLSTRVDGVREAIAAFGPVVAGRGVYQLSAYVDTILASLLAAGALASLRPALMLYILPVSLFGLSVAASELPELSRLRTADLSPFLRRLRRSMRQTLFLTVPTMMGYLAFGFLIVGALFRRGEFGIGDNVLVYAVLGGYALGLVATTISRLLQNAFYAIQDTKTPAKIAVVRLVVSAAVAVPLMFPLDTVAVSTLPWESDPGAPTYLGAVGLAVGASAGAWVELGSLLRALRSRLEAPVRLPWRRIAQMVGLALAAAALAAGLWWMLPLWPVVATAVLVVGTYAAVYLGLAAFAGFDELDAWTGRLLNRFRS